VTAAAVETVDTSPSWASSPLITLANFDGAPDSYANWTFFPGTEFAGASGSVGEAAGHSSTKAGALNYDLGCNRTADGLPNSACGRYVAMELRFSGTINTSSSQPAIGLWLRNAQGTARPTLRVTDSTKQVLQFQVPMRSLEQPAAGEWQYVEVPIASSKLFFSGAADGVLHPPIKSVAIMNGDLPMAYVPGSLEVDNVQLLNTPSTTFELKSNAPLSSKTFPSTYVGRIGVAVMNYTTAALDKAKAAGITLVRKDLCWSCVEVNGAFSFSRYNTFVSDIVARDMSVLWILDYGHPSHGGTAPRSNLDQAAFANFAKQAATTYKSNKVVGYEVWNEPNLGAYWPTPDANVYASLAQVTQAAIKSVNSTANVVTGGLAGVDLPFLHTMVSSGKLAGLTAFGVHPYRTTAPELYASDTVPLLRVLRNANLGAPMWDTESGYSSYGDVDATTYGNGADPRAQRRQGVLVLRKVMTHIALNTPISVIYNLLDSGTSATNREHNFGLLKYDGSDKPGIVGLRNLYAAQNGRVLKGFLPDVPPNLHVLRWDGTTDRAFAIWTDRLSGSYTVTLPTTVSSVTLWDGTVITPTVSGTRKTVTITEASGPVFVKITR
jgi:hypothetical protein